MGRGTEREVSLNIKQIGYNIKRIIFQISRFYVLTVPIAMITTTI